jgi:hypothetical protein
MPTLRHLLVLAALPALWLAAAPSATAAPAECELALTFAAVVEDKGQIAAKSDNFYVATDTASGARIAAIDAARFAKACGCPQAIQPLADAATAAARVNMDVNLTAVKQHAMQVGKGGAEATAALRKCTGG